MSNFKTDKSTYTPSDFLLWDNNGRLQISPKFQRRGVWRTPIRSFFIDTILRGMTVPPIYLRLIQDEKSSKQVNEVVDGQQRMSCVLDYMKDIFKLSTTLPAEWAGKRFSELPEGQKNLIRNFSFSCEIFKGISDQEVLEVFCRLNMYGVQLNKQELRNGRYFGVFKQLSYKLAFEYLQFWRNQHLFTENSIARMLEVELTSELLIAGSAGMQDKKDSIEVFYKEWNESYPDHRREEKRFQDVLEAISETFSPESLAGTEFHRPPMFYTLYCVVYHYMYGLPKIQRQTPKQKLTANARDSLQEATIELSDIIAQSKDKAEKTPAKYQAFVQASSRQTDNIRPRTERFNTLFGAAF